MAWYVFEKAARKFSGLSCIVRVPEQDVDAGMPILPIGLISLRLSDLLSAMESTTGLTDVLFFAANNNLLMPAHSLVRRN